MIPIYQNSDMPRTPCALAIGNFDGVHLGHQAILAHARACADTADLPLGVMLFDPHPRRFFAPDTPPNRLTKIQTRAEWLGTYNVDFVVVLTFDAALATKSADDFVTDILKTQYDVRMVIIGADFHYGRGRSGNAETLLKAGAHKKFSVKILPTIKNDVGQIYASSAIRIALSDGNPRAATTMLGRPWTSIGIVENGDARGRQIGFPTANIDLGDYHQPRHGVYAVRARIEKTNTYDGVANFGIRPTVDGTKPRLEVHLFDFDRDIYGAKVEVSWIDFIRPEQKFENIDALKAQIIQDCAKARTQLQKG